MKNVTVIAHAGKSAICIPNGMTGTRLLKFLDKNRTAIDIAKTEVELSGGKITNDCKPEIVISDSDDLDGDINGRFSDRLTGI